MSRRRTEIVLVTVFIAAVMAGWGLYAVDYDHVDCDISSDTDGITVDMQGFMPADYSYMLMSGGDVPDHLYYYFDEHLPADTTVYKQSEIQRVLDALLEIRGVSPGVRCDASRLCDLLKIQIGDGTASGNGLVFCSGALPHTLYADGTDLLDQWLNAGGTVYWMGENMGTRIAYPEEVVEDMSGSYFPEGSISSGDVRNAYRQSEWSSLLGMTIGAVYTGMNIDAVPGAVSLGLVDDEGYSALAECPHGNGRIYVIGYSVNNCAGTIEAMSIADAIATGIDHDTVLLKNGTGQKGYGQCTVRIDAEAHPGDVLRLTFGAPYISGGFIKTF